MSQRIANHVQSQRQISTNDGILDVITGGNRGSNRLVSVRLGNANGTFGAATTYNNGANNSWDVQIADINGDGFLDLIDTGTGGMDVRFGNGTGAFGAATRYAMEDISRSLSLIDVNNDSILDAVTVGFTSGNVGYSTIRLGNSNGTFGVATSYTMDSGQSRLLGVYDFNGDGNLDIMSIGINGGVGGYTVRYGNGNGTFGATTSGTTGRSSAGSASFGDLNLDGVVDVIIGPGFAQTGDPGFSTLLQNTQAGTSTLLPFSLTTQSGARDTLTLMKNTLTNLSKQRSVIGALMSRIGTAVSELGSRVENISAAHSRIMNTDVAEDAATLASSRILQQVGAAVLGQANQNPQIVLKLLQ